MLELRNVGGLKAEAAGLGFGVFAEGAFETELSFVFATFLLEGVDEEKVCAACGEDPAAISGDIETDDRLAKGGNVGFGIDPKTVEHADITFIGGDSNVSLLCGSSCREVVLGNILF